MYHDSLDDKLCAECRDSSSPFTMSFRLQSSPAPPAQCAWRPRIIRSLACRALQCSGGCHAVHDCGGLAAPTLFGFAWQTPSFLSLLFSSLDFSAHSSASRIPRARRSKTFAASERREREGGGRARRGGRRAMCTKNPRLLFVTRSAAAAVVLSGPGRHVHVNEHPMSGGARAAE